MSRPEQNLLLPRDQQFVRAVHPGYRSHTRFVDALKAELGGCGLYIDVDTFKDGSPHLQIIDPRGRGYDFEGRKPFDGAFVTLWVSPQFGDDERSLGFASQVINGLSHDGGSGPLVARTIAIAPYIGLRQDRPTKKKGRMKTGESIDAERIAEDLRGNGLRELVILEPHSEEAMAFFAPYGENDPNRDKNIESVCLTAAPLFADYLLNKGLITDDTSILALDKGSLQKNMRLASLVGLDLSHLVVFDKGREDGKVASSSLIYGQPRRRVIIFDDVIDTSETIGQKCETDLREKFKCEEIIVMATHGVLSHPARENILGFIESGVIDQVVITDSLPKAAYAFEDVDHVTILPVAPLMAGAAILVANSNPEITRKNFDPYVLTPMQKDQVWREFAQAVGIVS